MADRADFLARTVMTRLKNLKARFAEDNLGEPDRRQRIEVIEKVLAVELGVTDSTTMALVESAAPAASASERESHQELSQFAAFLRKHLRDQLSEP